MNNLPIEGLSEADVQFLIDNPGTNLSGRMGESPKAFSPTQSHSISSGASNVRPRVRGNETHDVRGAKISRPSASFPQRLADGDEALRAKAAAQKAAEEERRELSDIDRILSRISYLERTVKSQAKTIKELKSNG
jgi:hypothetical protein